MIKTQIQLEEWQYEALKRSSASSSRSMSDIIREGVTLLLNRTGRKSTTPLAQLAGKYRPVTGAELKPHDLEWVDSIR